MAREPLTMCGLEGLPETFIHELKGLDKKQLEQLRASLQSVGCFPWFKLPTELRLEILRLVWSASSSNIKFLKHGRGNISNNLLLVSKAFKEEAIWMFRRCKSARFVWDFNSCFASPHRFFWAVRQAIQTLQNFNLVIELGPRACHADEIVGSVEKCLINVCNIAKKAHNSGEHFKVHVDFNFYSEIDNGARYTFRANRYRYESMEPFQALHMRKLLLDSTFPAVASWCAKNEFTWSLTSNIEGTLDRMDLRTLRAVTSNNYLLRVTSYGFKDHEQRRMGIVTESESQWPPVVTLFPYDADASFDAAPFV